METPRFSCMTLLQYQLAFLQDDEAGMSARSDWSAGKQGVEDVMLGYEGRDGGILLGDLKKARRLSESGS